MSIPVLNRQQVSANFPQRPRDSHKGMFGTVAVIGGASGMIGAALLAARAALRLGAGCVHAGVLAENAPVVDMAQPELMLHKAEELLCPNPLPNHLPRAVEGGNVKGLFNPDVLAIGCGLGRGMIALQLVHGALSSKAALVMDADALNILAEHTDLKLLLSSRQAVTVLTPHPGEAARLLACKICNVQEDRVATVLRLVQEFSCNVVLKGASSLCATSDGRLFVNPTGNPGMSAAGMGDVLTGIIAAFIAQGMQADDALLLAVYLHGAAGDALARKGRAIGMTATEVIESARCLMNEWVNKQGNAKVMCL